ncbi:hypothetical protein S40288_01436 [Stachybotrys chartarum IBT 40288]|nr:hypothetical protein S40288_01436 [Stachybotrys chartarum IBT 40288]
MDPGTITENPGGFQFQTNSTSAVLNELRFAAAKQVRMSIVILASFNVLVAFATALGILWDSYQAAKKENPRFDIRKSFLQLVRATETFPLILSLGIVVQGITYAAAQARGLQSLSILGCESISELMLPAAFITPFIQFVLALEMVIRALRKRPFMPRAAWVLWACLAVVGTALLITYVVALLYRPPNFCFASLFWLITRWKLGIFVIMTLITSTLIISCGIIFIQLQRQSEVTPIERLAAVHMVYYLSSSILTDAFLIPFFFSVTFSDLQTAGEQPLQLSMAATVVANLTGLVTGGLYLFLRSNRASGVEAKEEELWDEKKSTKWGFSAFNPESGQPHSPEPTLQRVDSTDALRAQIAPPFAAQYRAQSSIYDRPVGQDEGAVERIGSLSQGQNYQRVDSGLSDDLIVQYQAFNNLDDDRGSVRQTLRTYSRKLSYSLFPSGKEPGQKQSTLLLPAATYNPSLAAPTVTELPREIQHRRKMSTNSTTTVQIGLRLSNVNDMPPLGANDDQDPSQVFDLSCPKFSGRTALVGPSPLSTSASVSDTQPMMSKDLPPLPPLPVERTGPEYEETQMIRLSPTVYSPGSPMYRKKTPTPVQTVFKDPVPQPLFTGKKDWI